MGGFFSKEQDSAALQLKINQIDQQLEKLKILKTEMYQRKEEMEKNIEEQKKLISEQLIQVNKQLSEAASNSTPIGYWMNNAPSSDKARWRAYDKVYDQLEVEKLKLRLQSSSLSNPLNLKLVELIKKENQLVNQKYKLQEQLIEKAFLPMQQTTVNKSNFFQPPSNQKFIDADKNQPIKRIESPKGP